MRVIIFDRKTGTLFFLFYVILLSATDTSAQTQPAGWLYTNGNRIYIADGDGDGSNDAVFAGRGANIFDTRSCSAGYWNQNVNEVKRRIDELVDVWGADFMRLCLESKDVLSEWMVHGLSLADDTTGYLEDIVEIVDHISKKANTYVMVSMWASSTLDDMGWPTDATNKEWEILVPALVSYPQVIFGVCNEPESNNNGSLDADVLARMNTAVTAIREAEAGTSYPQHVISVQGTRQWARYIDYYIDKPVTAFDGTNIAYETHPYNHDFGQWFYTAQQKIPVIIGEFGPATVNGTLYMTLDECKLMMDTADALQIPYAAWSFHQRCPPNLFVDQTGSGLGVDMEIEPTEWGEALKEHLLGIEKPGIDGMSVIPSSILNNVSNTVLVSATVTSKKSPLSSVTVDLSQLGLGSSVAMTKNSDVYTYEFVIEAGITGGTKTVTITATDQAGQSRSKYCGLDVIAPATEKLVIYSDGENLIGSTWNSNGNLSELSVKPFEGTSHYLYEFKLADWWQGKVWGDNFGLNLSGDGGIDFSGYDRICFAGCLTGDVKLTMNLADVSGVYSETIDVEGISSDYAVFTLPLTDFIKADLSTVGEIKFDVSSDEEKSGTLYIDYIYLLPAGAALRDGDRRPPYLEKLTYQEQVKMITTTENGNVVATYSLATPRRAKMVLYDQQGRQMAVTSTEMMPAGLHTIVLKTKSLPSGVYIVKITLDGQYTQFGKFILKK